MGGADVVARRAGLCIPIRLARDGLPSVRRFRRARTVWREVRSPIQRAIVGRGGGIWGRPTPRLSVRARGRRGAGHGPDPMTRRLGLGVVLLAWLLPALTWWQIAPATSFVDALLETPLFLFTAGGLGLVGVLLATWDRWLGIFVCLAAVAAVHQQTYLALATAHWIALGAVGVEAVRQTPAP